MSYCLCALELGWGMCVLGPDVSGKRVKEPGLRYPFGGRLGGAPEKERLLGGWEDAGNRGIAPWGHVDAEDQADP